MLQLHPLKERGHGASAGAAEGVRPLAGCGRGRGMGATEGGAVGGACGGVELLDELPPPGQSPAGRPRERTTHVRLGIFSPRLCERERGHSHDCDPKEITK